MHTFFVREFLKTNRLKCPKFEGLINNHADSKPKQAKSNPYTAHSFHDALKLQENRYYIHKYIHTYIYTDSPEEPILCNIITSISDLLAQFLLFPIEKTKGSMHKEICKGNFKSLTSNELIEVLKSIEWYKSLRLNQRQTNKSFKLFSTILNPF